MKKFILTLLCLSIVSFAFAQTNDNSETNAHLTFKGIPIDGTPASFGSKLKANGFRYDMELDGTIWYKGSFAGYYDCQVAVKSNNNLVYEIVVLFPKSYSWSHLYNTYTSLKDMLTTKYGEPSSSREEFINTPSYMNIEDDNDKFYEVKNDRCLYYSNFVCLKGGLGTITMEIKKSCCVALFYTDYLNELAKESAAINDL